MLFPILFCFSDVYLLRGSGPCRLVEIAVHIEFATDRYHKSHFAILTCLSNRSHTAVDGSPPDTPTTDSYTVTSSGYPVLLVPGPSTEGLRPKSEYLVPET